MGPMANGAQGVWGTRGMGHIGNGVLGVWGIWTMKPIGSMGYKGYGPHGQWDTWAMGPMGNLLPKYQKDVKLSKRCQVVKKMSSCQNDVKCQKIKHLDYGGGSQEN